MTKRRQNLRTCVVLPQLSSKLLSRVSGKRPVLDFFGLIGWLSPHGNPIAYGHLWGSS